MASETLRYIKRITQHTLQSLYMAIFGFGLLAIISGSIFLCYTMNHLQQENKTPPDMPSPIQQDMEAFNKPATFYQKIDARNVHTTFADVAGMHEVKDEVQDILYYLENQSRFTSLGAKPPKGIILSGAPGTGKTLLARALAGEAGINFLSTTGSSFEDTYIGVGAARIRELFQQARKLAPCIIFIDEIDSVAKNRKNMINEHITQIQTLNQLLSELDGIDPSSNAGVFVIAATNQVDIIDPALLRPGRLDRQINIPMPTTKERGDILSLHMKNIKHLCQDHVQQLAKMTSGFSSADLAQLVNEAAIDATKQSQLMVELKNFEFARERIIMGLKNKSILISSKERQNTAVHEAGHTLVGVLLNPDMPVFKVTITPHGQSLGATHFYSEEEQHSYSLNALENIIATKLAGRIAEELVYGFGETTNGASSDFLQATSLATKMVTKWGFSNKVGTVYLMNNHDWLKNELIQKEVKVILDKCYQKAKKTLIKNRAILDHLTKELLEKETLNTDDIKSIVAQHHAKNS